MGLGRIWASESGSVQDNCGALIRRFAGATVNESDVEKFASKVRRRSSLGQAAAVSGTVAAVLSGVGVHLASKSVVCLAGLAWFATSVTVYRLQRDGYVPPSATIDSIGYTAKDRQAAVPFIFFLWGLGAFAVAYAMK
jgi:hypothetical protein